MRRGFLLPLIVCLLFVPAAAAQAQLSKSIGIGVASPQGEFGDYFDEGYTVRGQFQLSALGLIAVHTQAGWTRFSSDFDPGTVVPDSNVPASIEGIDGDADILHAGVGARLGVFGLAFVGANAAYFFGDGDEDVGFFPEIGVGLGPLEVVADYRIGSDFNWFGLRGALKF